MIINDSLKAVMEQRRSIRSYDPTYKISREKILEMLQEASTAPSSHNLQSWRFIIIDTPEEKKVIRKIAWNQEQVETSSATIAIIGDAKAFENAEAIAQKSMDEGLMTHEAAQNYIQGVMQLYPHASEEALKEIARFDGGLFAMQLMLIAKAHGLDTVCMGGFDKEALAKHYDLAEQYVPLVLISIGKAANPGYETTRLNVSDLILK